MVTTFLDFSHRKQTTKDGKIIKNVFDDLPQHLPKEIVQTLIRAADVRIERIISHGHASPADFSARSSSGVRREQGIVGDAGESWIAARPRRTANERLSGPGTGTTN